MHMCRYRQVRAGAWVLPGLEAGGASARTPVLDPEAVHPAPSSLGSAGAQAGLPHLPLGKNSPSHMASGFLASHIPPREGAEMGGGAGREIMEEAPGWPQRQGRWLWCLAESLWPASCLGGFRGHIFSV